MNWKSFLLGAAVGIVGGYAAREILSQKSKISPDKALIIAKEVFKKHGPISGSWILMNAEKYEKNEIQYDVYRGGISRLTGENMVQYEFISDASTGTIIEAYQL